MSESQIPLEFAESPGFLFIQAAKIIRRSVEEALAPMELHSYEYGLLKVISVTGPLSQQVFADRFSIDKTTVVDIVKNLEKRDLIYRKRSDLDRRVKLLHLTPRGNATVTRATKRVHKAHREFIDPLSDEEWDLTKRVILKLLTRHQI